MINNRRCLFGIFLLVVSCLPVSIAMQRNMLDTSMIDKSLHKKEFSKLKDIKIYMSSPQDQFRHAFFYGAVAPGGLVETAIYLSMNRKFLRENTFPPENMPARLGDYYSKFKLDDLGGKVNTIIGAAFEEPLAFKTKDIITLKNSRRISSEGLNRFSQKRNQESAHGVMQVTTNIFYGMDGLQLWLKTDIEIWAIPTKLKGGKHVTIGKKINRKYIRQRFMVMADARDYKGLQENGRDTSDAYAKVSIFMAKKMAYMLKKYIANGELLNKKYDEKELLIIGVRKSKSDLDQLEASKMRAQEKKRAMSKAQKEVRNLLRKDKYEQNAELLYRTGYHPLVAYLVEELPDGLLVRSRDRNTLYYLISKPSLILKNSEIHEKSFESFPLIREKNQ